jgi:death-on-curing protein
VSDPTFLGLDEVIELHADQVERYGGASGIRDLGLLESALALPAATFDGRFLHESVFEMAAAYLVSIAQSHPFVDGNKRAALITAIAFLGLNGWRVHAEVAPLIELVLAVAERKRSKAEVTVFFQASCRRA